MTKLHKVTPREVYNLGVFINELLTHQGRHETLRALKLFAAVLRKGGRTGVVTVDKVAVTHGTGGAALKLDRIAAAIRDGRLGDGGKREIFVGEEKIIG